MSTTLGAFLREKRGATTQYELAAKAGIHPTALSMYEHDKRIPGVDALRKIATALNLSREEIGVAVGLTGASDD